MKADTTIKEALLEASKKLGSPKEASILMQHYLGIDQVGLILRENEPLKDSMAYQRLVDKRVNHVPIEYITNRVSFYSREFYIKPGALIPRPETELLIDNALRLLNTISSHKRVVEVGTGSGIIPVMLAILCDDIHITATDISMDAIEIAKINAKRFGVEEKITFVHTSYLQGVEGDFDMIISNPPYIANDFTLEPSLGYEPQAALFGGEIGDEMLKIIIDTWLEKETPYLLCEMGYDQKGSIGAYLAENQEVLITFYQDLAGLDRGFVVKRQKE